VAELQFHHTILSVIGIVGIVWFFGALHLPEVWSRSRRLVVGIAGGAIYVVQACGASPILSSASSLELFGFIGCIVGALNAARIMGDTGIPSRGPDDAI
jgi:hypothetical protein